MYQIQIMGYITRLQVGSMESKIYAVKRLSIEGRVGDPLRDTTACIQGRFRSLVEKVSLV